MQKMAAQWGGVRLMFHQCSGKHRNKCNKCFGAQVVVAVVIIIVIAIDRTNVFTESIKAVRQYFDTAVAPTWVRSMGGAAVDKIL